MKTKQMYTGNELYNKIFYFIVFVVMAFLISSCGGNNNYTPPSEEQTCSSSGASWLSGAGCCGDSNEDCGVQVNGAICSMDENFASSNWISATNSVGKIITVGCKDIDYVSDGSKWVGCNEFSITSIAGHDYLCNGNRIVRQ